jgi:hypothetical protein
VVLTLDNIVVNFCLALFHILFCFVLFCGFLHFFFFFFSPLCEIWMIDSRLSTVFILYG